jgi:hypothetical protein
VRDDRRRGSIKIRVHEEEEGAIGQTGTSSACTRRSENQPGLELDIVMDL